MKRMGNNIFGIRRMLVILIALSMLSACEERWEEMNTDPNQLSSLSDEYLFTNAVRGSFMDQRDLEVSMHMSGLAIAGTVKQINTMIFSPRETFMNVFFRGSTMAPYVMQWKSCN